MARKRRPEDLSEAELRRLLVQKRRAARKDRLEAYQHSGRLVQVAPSEGAPRLDDFPTGFEGETVDVGESRRKRILDRLLLGAEVLAVIGLAFVIFNGANLLRELNQQVVAALEQATFTPTALIQAVVLPSGHTPPTDPGGAQPNEAEIPEHLRPLVQSLANIPIPTPSPEQAIQVRIPAINVDAPVVLGDGWEQLKKGVGQHIGSANPGEEGNLVLSAHNDVFGELFRRLDELQPGDEITVFSNLRAYTYVVTETQIVAPTFVQVMDPTPDPTITLISCYPYLVNSQRIVVRGVLLDS